MKLTKKITSLEESLTLAITAIAKGLKAEGKDVISFSAGEPDFDTPKAVKQAAIDAINKGCSAYTPVPGMPSVLEAIVNKLKKDNNLTYSTSDIITNAGAKHSLFNAIAALVEEGDEVLIPVPYWVSYPEIVKYHGGTPVFIYPSDGLKITADDLKKHINANTKMFILNNPSNPTGEIYTKDELLAFAKVLEGTDIVVLSDEIYEKLSYDVEFVSFASLRKDAYDRTVTINGLSKCAAMPGWRFGYSASGNKELNKVMKNLQGQCTSNINTIVQHAAISALRGDIDEDIKYMNSHFIRRRDIACKMLSEIDGIKFSKPAGAFYIFMDIKAITEDDMDFCKRLLEEKLVAMVPGIGFGMSGYIRMSYATSEENIKTGLARLQKFVKEYKKG